MQGHYHKFHSSQLGEDFELKTYGHAGRPMVVFPSGNGRYYDFENFGMVHAIAPYLAEGRLRVICIDGRDHQTWANRAIHPHHRALRYDAYDRAIVQEVLPWIRHESGPRPPRDLILAGCSMGAYHAANFLFRHPDLADTGLFLSGIYGLHHYIGDYSDHAVYFHEPLRYLAGLPEGPQMDLLRNSDIVLCCGSGAHEEDCLTDTRHLSGLLWSRNIPHWLDIWGHDVHHDWPWWAKQLPYFLGHTRL
jgi:esterase/lipase superfamily enzyme